MDSLLCPKCGSENFKGVVEQITDVKKVVAHTHVHPDGSVDESNEIKSFKDSSRKEVSFICESCGSEYILAGRHLIPAWL